MINLSVIIIGCLTVLVFALAKKLKQLIPAKETILLNTVKAAERPTSPAAPKPSKELTKQKFKPELVPTELDVIVIGSGIGGLSTAAALSKAGYKVLVLEQHGKAGGCCHSFKSQKHYEFDTGIHFVGKMDPDRSGYYKLLNQLAVEQIDWVSQGDPYDRVEVHDGFCNNNSTNHRVYGFGIGRDNTLEMLKQKFPNDHEAIDEFFRLLDLDSVMGSTYTLGKLIPIWAYQLLYKTKLYSLFGDNFAAYFDVGQKPALLLLDELTDNTELKSVLLYLIPTIGFDLDPSPFYILSGVIQHYMKQGAWYPVGGGHMIVQNIVPTIEAAGGRVLVRADVKSITLDPSGRACGVVVENAMKQYAITAPIIISAAGITPTFKNLLPKEVAEASRYYKYISNPGTSLNLLFVGLNGSAEDLDLDCLNHIYMDGPDMVNNVRKYKQLSSEDILDAPIPFYMVTFPSAKDPAYAKKFPGKSVCIMATPTTWEWYKEFEESSHKKRPADYKDHKQQLMHHIWTHGLRHFPELEDRVEYIEMATPVTMDHYIRSDMGSISGLAHDNLKFDASPVAELRAETDVPGLYLTGQDILTGGFTGAFTAGLFCTEVILKKHGFKS